MASPNTLKIMEEKRTLRMRGIRIIPSYPGANRKERRREMVGHRLRSKMRKHRWDTVYGWKYPKSKSRISRVFNPSGK